MSKSNAHATHPQKGTRLDTSSAGARPLIHKPTALGVAIIYGRRIARAIGNQVSIIEVSKGKYIAAPSNVRVAGRIAMTIEPTPRTKGKQGNTLEARIGRLQAARKVKALKRSEIAKQVAASATGDADEDRHTSEFETVRSRIVGLAGSPSAADDWIRSYRIPGYGGKTAQDLIEQDRLESLERYLDAIEHGVHA